MFLGLLGFGIASIQAACAWRLRRQAVSSLEKGWRVQAVLALVWIHLTLTMLTRSDTGASSVGLILVLGLLTAAWYADRRARRLG
jgi:hypothetical protein